MRTDTATRLVPASPGDHRAGLASSLANLARFLERR
jgi:hypothetical protein